jgi:hypothetical protein
LAILVAVSGAAGCEQMIGLNEGKPKACASPIECASPGPCAVATCVGGVCGQAPANDLEACDDGDPCTEDDVCQAGQCTGGAQKSCPDADACNVGVCDPTTGGCAITPADDGALCGSGDECTEPRTCAGGVCMEGAPVDCSAYDGPCTAGACNPMVGCTPTPANEGLACDDGLFCTIGDVCSTGTCGGAPKVCNPPGNVCMIASCDENADACEAAPGPDGVTCDDGDACTSGDACQSGLCAGPAIVICVNGDGCCPTGCTTAMDDDCDPLQAMAYDVTQWFFDTLQPTQMAVAWDGANLWSCSGGLPNGVRLARYSPSGMPLSGYQPDIDFRVLFTKGDGTSPVYAREFASSQIRVQTSPGVFGNDVVLSGGNLDSQSSVIYDAVASQFVAFNAGVVTRWADNGSFMNTLTLVGFGSMNNENDFPQNRKILYRSGYFLTYSNGTLSAWNAMGQRVSSSDLDGGGTSTDSHFSLSYAAGKVWVMDTAGGTWLGYDVGL